MAIEEVTIKNPTAFSNVKGYLQNLTNKFFMRPKNAEGIAGWVFDIEGETNASISAEITDHYVEDNTAIQDHIAIRPLKIHLRGYVGELTYKQTAGFSAVINAIQSRLTSVPAYLGPLTPGGIKNVQRALTKVTSVINQANQIYNKTKNIYGFFANSNPHPTKQEKAFSHFMASMNSRTAMVITTPYGTFDNMIIENVAMIQDESTKSWSDISIILKQLNVIPIHPASADKNITRNASQKSSRFKKGITKGLAVAVSKIETFFNGSD